MHSLPAEPSVTKAPSAAPPAAPARWGEWVEAPVGPPVVHGELLRETVKRLSESACLDRVAGPRGSCVTFGLLRKKLGEKAIMVWAALCVYRDKGTGVCYPSRKRIGATVARYFGVALTIRQVEHQLTKLRKFKLVALVAEHVRPGPRRTVGEWVERRVWGRVFRRKGVGLLVRVPHNVKRALDELPGWGGDRWGKSRRPRRIAESKTGHGHTNGAGPTRSQGGSPARSQDGSQNLSLSSSRRNQSLSTLGEDASFPSLREGKEAKRAARAWLSFSEREEEVEATAAQPSTTSTAPSERLSRESGAASSSIASTPEGVARARAWNAIHHPELASTASQTDAPPATISDGAPRRDDLSRERYDPGLTVFGRILVRLQKAGGPQTTAELATALQIDRDRVEHELADAAGLVECDPSGRWRPTRPRPLDRAAKESAPGDLPAATRAAVLDALLMAQLNSREGSATAADVWTVGLVMTGDRSLDEGTVASALDKLAVAGEIERVRVTGEIEQARGEQRYRRRR